MLTRLLLKTLAYLIKPYPYKTISLCLYPTWNCARKFSLAGSSLKQTYYLHTMQRSLWLMMFEWTLDRCADMNQDWWERELCVPGHLWQSQLPISIEVKHCELWRRRDTVCLEDSKYSLKSSVYNYQPKLDLVTWTRSLQDNTSVWTPVSSEWLKRKMGHLHPSSDGSPHLKWDADTSGR